MASIHKNVVIFVFYIKALPTVQIFGAEYVLDA